MYIAFLDFDFARCERLWRILLLRMRVTPIDSGSIVGHSYLRPLLRGMRVSFDGDIRIGLESFADWWFGILQLLITFINLSATKCGRPAPVLLQRMPITFECDLRSRVEIVVY
jgi:hypothetical protein